MNHYEPPSTIRTHKLLVKSQPFDELAVPRIHIFALEATGLGSTSGGQTIDEAKIT